VCLGDCVEVVILSHDRKSVLDGGGCDQRVEYARTNACTSAIVHKPCKRRHHRFADGDGIGRTGERERVGASSASIGVAGSQDSEFELADRDDRYGKLGRQLAERPLGLLRDEDRRVSETSAHNSSIVPPAR